MSSGTARVPPVPAPSGPVERPPRSFTRGAQHVEGTARHHVDTVAHLRRLLTDGGFTDVALSGGPDDEPFDVGNGRLLLTASRPRDAARTRRDSQR